MTASVAVTGKYLPLILMKMHKRQEYAYHSRLLARSSVLFEIKAWIDGGVLFYLETDSFKLCIEAAVKSGANLRSADLRGAYLRGADLRGANLGGAYLHSADLRGANLRSADLRGAYLRGAYLNSADLRGADLRGADLRGAYLRGAYLRGADLRGADLRGDNNIPELVAAESNILPDGPCIGWKKCRRDVIVKLLIPHNARKSNASGRKCRADFVKVLQVFGAEFGVSQHNSKVEYRKGQTVTCDKWNEDRWTECGGGIHFFISRIEAENYQ